MKIYRFALVMAAMLSAFASCNKPVPEEPEEEDEEKTAEEVGKEWISKFNLNSYTNYYLIEIAPNLHTSSQR